MLSMIQIFFSVPAFAVAKTDILENADILEGI